MKKLLALVLCLLLCGTAAMAEVYIVYAYGGGEYPGGAILIDDDGTLLAPSGAYEMIGTLTPDGTPESERLYYAEPTLIQVPVDQIDEDNYYSYYRLALMGPDGSLLTGYDYCSLEYAGPDRIVFMLPSQARGVMDFEGNVFLEAGYAALVPDGQGGWLGLAMDAPARDYDECYPLVHIDAEGNVTETGLHAPVYAISGYSEGLCPVNEVEEYHGRTVYLDQDGCIAFDGTFDYGEQFFGNLACVTAGETSGLIGKDGQFVVNPGYEYISQSDSDRGPIYIAHAGTGFAVFSADTGETLLEMDFEDVEYVSAWMDTPSLIKVTTGDESFLYTLDGQLVRTLGEDEDISVSFNSSDGTVDRLIESSGPWPDTRARLIDMDGNAIGPDYREINGAIWRDGHGLFITQEYRIIPDDEGEYMVDWRSMRCGVCDEDGNEILPCVYDSVSVLGMDRFWVTRGSRTGMINREGLWYYAVNEYENLVD